VRADREKTLRDTYLRPQSPHPSPSPKRGEILGGYLVESRVGVRAVGDRFLRRPNHARPLFLSAVFIFSLDRLLLIRKLPPRLHTRYVDDQPISAVTILVEAAVRSGKPRPSKVWALCHPLRLSTPTVSHHRPYLRLFARKRLAIPKLPVDAGDMLSDLVIVLILLFGVASSGLRLRHAGNLAAALARALRGLELVTHRTPSAAAIVSSPPLGGWRVGCGVA